MKAKYLMAFFVLIVSLMLVCCENEVPTLTPESTITIPEVTLQTKEQTPTPTPTLAPPETKITGVPIIKITTSDGAKIPDDKSYVTCKVSLDCSVDAFCANELEADIRVRGNGSLSVGRQFGKFSYKLKFENKINPFGLGEVKSKDWALISDHSDRTMLRNYAAKRLGDMLEGIPYSPNTMHVQVFLNGEFMGLYGLSEMVEVGDGRVDVDDSCASREIGFLVELDHYAGNDPSDIYFKVGSNKYTVKSEVNSDEQLGYIKEYIAYVDNAISLGNRNAIEKLVDVDSLVDMYILQEYLKNTDAGYSSFFMSKDIGGKLTFTAPWDFDLSTGNDDRVDNGAYHMIYVGLGRPGYMQNHHWYIKLYSLGWFRQMVKERWNELSDTVIEDLIQEIETKAQSLRQPLMANFTRWCLPVGKFHQEPMHVYKMKTSKEHTEYLINWLKDRKEWLDGYWNL